MSEWVKIMPSMRTTIVAWGIGIAISVVAVAKGSKMKDEMGVSLKTYLSLVAITEVLYTVGGLMVLAAMGVECGSASCQPGG